MAGRLGVTAGLTKHNFLAIVFTSPAALCAAMAEFIEFHNYRRYHEWIRNVAPADVYFGRWEEIRNQRKEQKQATIQGRSQYSLGQPRQAAEAIDDRLEKARKKNSSENVGTNVGTPEEVCA